MSSTLVTGNWTTAPSLTEQGRHEHGLDTTVGYQVVKTYRLLHDIDGKRAGTVEREIDHDSPLYAPNEYARAMARVRELRAEQQEFDAVTVSPWRAYAVIDTLYACGCRSDRVTG